MSSTETIHCNTECWKMLYLHRVLPHLQCNSAFIIPIIGHDTLAKFPRFCAFMPDSGKSSGNCWALHAMDNCRSRPPGIVDGWRWLRREIGWMGTFKMSHVAFFILSGLKVWVVFFGLDVRTGILGVVERTKERLLSDWHFLESPVFSRPPWLEKEAERASSLMQAAHQLCCFVRRVPGRCSFNLSLTFAGHEPIFIHDDPNGVSWTGVSTSSLQECFGLIALSVTISIRPERNSFDNSGGNRSRIILWF